MRGLDIRIMLAHERVSAIIDGRICGSVIDEYTLGSHLEAHRSGYADARRGRTEPPAMFRDEPILVSGWKAGVDAFEDEREMSACDGCNDGTGNSCHIHG